jgi:hypothetical protein
MGKSGEQASLVRIVPAGTADPIRIDHSHDNHSREDDSR